jgi:hypothetical protein
MEETIMTIKDLLNDQSLLNSIVEDLDDFPVESKITYEVWALGYTKEDIPLDYCYSLGEFEDIESAVAFVNEVNLTFIRSKGPADLPKEIAQFSLEVETTVEDPFGIPGDTVNIGTVYQKLIEVI